MNNIETIEYESLKASNKAFEAEFQLAYKNFIEEGWYILGKRVESFESAFKGFCGTKHCIGVANGLDALVIAIQALNLPKNSEIIVPSNTYIASILAILQTGHIPVPVEPELESYNIDPSKIENAITKKTSAILVVHLYGKLCRMVEISLIAEKYNLQIIEDAAQAHGSSFRGKKAGNWGNVAGFSFYPTKNLGCLGDGGGITTNSDEIAIFCKKYRNYGSNQKYHNEIIGTNSRLDELQAAFLEIKLKSIDKITDHKQHLAKIYQKELSDKIIKPIVEKDFVDVHHIYPIRTILRDELRKYLLERNIKTEVHYPIAPHKQKAMNGIWSKYNLPLSEEIHNTILSLPISFATTEKQVERVIEIINKFVN